MVIVALLELVGITLMLYLGVTQAILPLWRGTSLFPMFRKEGRLQHELTEASEDVIEAQLERKIAETAQRADSVRQKISRPIKPVSEPSQNVNR